MQVGERVRTNMLGEPEKLKTAGEAGVWASKTQLAKMREPEKIDELTQKARREGTGEPDEERQAIVALG